MTSYTSSAGPFMAYDAPTPYDTATYERWGLFVPEHEAMAALHAVYFHAPSHQVYPTIGSADDWKSFDDDMNNRKQVSLPSSLLYLSEHC
jgi:hypothetical protein